MSEYKVPKVQRALVLQGGGALGAYEAGVFKALYEIITKQDELNGETNRPLFDVVAGTSSGAINAAILVSYVVENKSWKGASERLYEFWEYLSSNPNLGNWWPFSIDDKSWISIWNERHNVDHIAATGEVARRYYSAKEYLYSGAPNVFSKSTLEYDNRFFDDFYPPSNMWYRYNNQPLKESIEKFVKFPIATTYDKNEQQPRLLMVSVDVQEGATVIFDSYPKKAGSRKSEYTADGQDEEIEGGFKQIIKYDDGINSDHVIASTSTPINYNYTTLVAEEVSSKNDGAGKNNSKKTHYFWDGGLLSNTPLRELIHAHRDYWFKVKGIKVTVPGLDVCIVDLHPSKQDNISIDRDGVINRSYDVIYHDRNVYDIKVANIVSDYVDLTNELIKLAKDNSLPENSIKEILNKQTKKSRSRTGQRRHYKDLLEGRFDINAVIHLERRNDANAISNKAFDFSVETIKQLRENGYNETIHNLTKQLH